MATNQSSSQAYPDAERARQLNFSANVEGGEYTEVVREVPFDGKAVELFYGASAAAQNRVGVSMKYRGTGEQVFPGDRETDFVNLAGVNKSFILVYPVEEAEEIAVQYDNRDDEGHYMNVILTVISEEGEEE